MMGWYNQGNGGLWMVLMPLMWIAIIGIAALVVVAITRSSSKRDQPRTETPEDILRRRLAAGELTSEEYARTRDLLHKQQ